MTAPAHTRLHGAHVWVQHFPDLHMHMAWVHDTTEFACWAGEDHPHTVGMPRQVRADLVAQLLFELVARAKA